MHKGHITLGILLVFGLLFLNTSGTAQEPRPKPTPREIPIKVEYLMKETKVPAGKKLIIRYKLTETSDGSAINDLKDARNLVFLAPGIWQQRGDAKFIADGVYEHEVTPPHPGVYMVFVQIPSRNIAFKDLPPHRFEVAKAE